MIDPAQEQRYNQADGAESKNLCSASEYRFLNKAMPKLLPTLRKNSRQEPAPNRKRWTRRECEFLVQSELLTGRYELIDGEIISKMGQKPPHSFVIMRLTAWLVTVFRGAFVRIRLPIDVSDSDNETNEPEPDAAVTSVPDVDLLTGNPGPTDLILVVEVSDTTLRFDLRAKAALTKLVRAALQLGRGIDPFAL